METVKKILFLALIICALDLSAHDNRHFHSSNQIVGFIQTHQLAGSFAAAGSCTNSFVTDLTTSGPTCSATCDDDDVYVNNGSGWVCVDIPDCDNPTVSKLLYDETTNTFSCGTDQGSSAPVVSWVIATATADQSINDNTETTVTFDDETEDTDSYHDDVTDNTKFFAPFNGVYNFYCLVRFDLDTVGSTYRLVLIRIDGTTNIGSPTQQATSGGFGNQIIATSTRRLTAGQYAECRVRHVSGGAINSDQVAGATPMFIMTYLGQ